jgi:acetolactate synthase I/II/III large subunit
MVNPDFIMVAKAYGIKGQTVNHREDLDAAIAEMLSDDEAYLLEVNVETKGMVYPMVPTGASISNMIIGDK